MSKLQSNIGPRSPASDLTVLILLNVIWGSTDVAAKYAVSEMAPASVAWVRFSIALLVFAPVLMKRRSEIPRTVKGLLPFVALGICGFFGNFVLHYHGLSLAPASHATALRVSEALVIVALSYLILRERVGRKALFGLLSGAAGVTLVLDIDLNNLSLFASGYRLGDLIIIGGIFVEALYTIIGKRVLVRTRPLTATALACVFGWVLLTVFYGPSVAADLSRNPPSWMALLACAFLGLVASALCYWVWYRVLSRRDSHRVGITIMVQPAVGIPLAALVFGDNINPFFLGGAALIAAGVYFALGKDSSGEDSPPFGDNAG